MIKEKDRCTKEMWEMISHSIHRTDKFVVLFTDAGNSHPVPYHFAVT